MEADTSTIHLAFAYKGSKRGDALLMQAAAHARSLNADLAVVVPLVFPADGPGCCGIRGARWHDMLRQIAGEDAKRARRILEDVAVPHSVTVAEGSSGPAIVEAFASDRRQLALPMSPRGSAFTRSGLRRLKRSTTGPVHVLCASPT